MVNKKVVIICSIIAVLIVAGIVAIQIKKWKEEENRQEETTLANTNLLSNQNSVENEIKEENIIEENTAQNENTTTNEVVQNQTQNQNQNQIQTQVQGQEESTEEAPEENNDDKALRLVKEEWGEDDTVYYTIDNQSNNTYNISVRSKSTTATLAEYEVDISKGTAEIK